MVKQQYVYNKILKYSRDEPRRHCLAVFLVSLAVLLDALVLVAEDAVDEQAGEEHKVHECQPRVRGGAGRGEAPRQRQHELKDVVEVARDAPEAADQQTRLADLAALVLVLHGLKLQ